MHPCCIRTMCLCLCFAYFFWHSQLASLAFTSQDLDMVVFSRSLLKCITMDHISFLTLLIISHVILKLFDGVSFLKFQLLESTIIPKMLGRILEHNRYSRNLCQTKMISFTFSLTSFLGFDLYTFFISYLDNSVNCSLSDAAPGVLVNNLLTQTSYSYEISQGSWNPAQGPLSSLSAVLRGFFSEDLISE